MPTTTILLILLAFLISVAVAALQYFYKTKERTSRKLLFGSLRFISLFSLLLLLINPKIREKEYFEVRPELAVVVDNSSSISNFGKAEEVRNFVQSFKSDSDLNEKFNLEFYSFGKTIKNTDTFSFEESQTNISGSLKTLDQLYEHKIAPAVLITDGNQTMGEDLSFAARTYSQPILPVVVGDTTHYNDLEISRLNVNKYAFLKNWFPVEVIITYSGQGAVNSRLQIRSGNVSLFTKDISLDESNNSVVIEAKLPSVTIGVNTYEVRLRPLPDEKNVLNNNREFAVEVIDERSSILIVYSKLHPDLGALKKAIESNEQREAVLRHIGEVEPSRLDAHQLVVLFQPTNSFQDLMKTLEEKKENFWIITGSETDWRFLNREQKIVQQEISSQTEEYFPVLNENFAAFQVNDIGFSSFPPLQGTFGKMDFSEALDILLYKQVQGVELKQPLLAFADEKGSKIAFLFGTGLWKWRSEVYQQNSSFESFDELIGKTVQFLSSGRKKERLSLSYRPLYQGSEDLVITAEYFDKNYVFDPRARIDLRLENETSGEVRQIPFMLNGSHYRVDLSNLNAGEYKFTASVSGEEITSRGKFRLLDFDVEKQFMRANSEILQMLAHEKNQELYFLQDFGKIKSQLLSEESYRPVQKSRENTVPLIDWFYLLGIIILSLSLEWFLRKYYGYI